MMYNLVSHVYKQIMHIIDETNIITTCLSKHEIIMHCSYPEPLDIVTDKTYMPNQDQSHFCLEMQIWIRINYLLLRYLSFLICQ